MMVAWLLQPLASIEGNIIHHHHQHKLNLYSLSFSGVVVVVGGWVLILPPGMCVNIIFI
ncbi:hypothetical protein Hanom_Chr09g00789131 [Helianthus anomalus]